MKKKGYVLDSFALLAYLQAESNGSKVKEVLREALFAKTAVYMSIISLGEVLYITERKLGKETATAILHDILRLPIHLAETTMDCVVSAAHIKARYAMSYADTFVVALAAELKATIITGDPEFKQVETMVDISWL